MTAYDTQGENLVSGFQSDVHLMSDEFRGHCSTG